MYKADSILENEAHKILWDLEIQAYHLTPARRPKLVIVNKEKKRKKEKREPVE